MIRNGDALRERLYANAARFRSEMDKLGFTLAGADHPIIPVMLGDASLAQEMAARHAEARASMSSVSRSRWCRRDRHASARQMSACAFQRRYRTARGRGPFGAVR